MIVGAILAGGASVRMGSDKAFAPLGGRPLVRSVYEALKPLGQIIVVANDATNHRATLGQSVRHVRDHYPGAGPLAGIHAALSALQPGEECVVAATCDMPFVFFELVRALGERVARGDEPHAGVWVDGTGRRQHFPAAFHRRALPTVQARLVSGDRSMRGLLDELQAATIHIDDVAPSGSMRAQVASFNVNTPEDLVEAERIAAALAPNEVGDASPGRADR